MSRLYFFNLVLVTGYFAFVPLPLETVPPVPDAVPCDVDDDEDPPPPDETFPLVSVFEPLSPCVGPPCDPPCVPPVDTFVLVPDPVLPPFCEEPLVLSVSLGTCDAPAPSSFEFVPFPFTGTFALADESVLPSAEFPFSFEFSIDASVTVVPFPICGLAAISVSSAMSLSCCEADGCNRIGSVFRPIPSPPVNAVMRMAVTATAMSEAITENAITLFRNCLLRRSAFFSISESGAIRGDAVS